MCSTCRKSKHFKIVNRSLTRDACKIRQKADIEACQSDDESWKGSDEETYRAIDIVRVKSFSFNSICIIIVTKLTGSSSCQEKKKKEKEKYSNI